MSALVYYLQRDLCVLAADRLARPHNRDGSPIAPDGPDRTPSQYTKLRIYPAYRMAVSFLGIYEVGGAWGAQLDRFRMASPSITALDRVTPQWLRYLYRGLRLSSEAGHYVRIFHFGWDPESDEVVAFEYHNEADFESERISLPPGDPNTRELVALPHQGLEGYIQAEAQDFFRGERPLHETCARLICAQKEFWDGKPPAEREIAIGGAIDYLVMTRDAFTLQTIHHFPDAPTAPNEAFPEPPPELSREDLLATARRHLRDLEAQYRAG